MPLIIACLHTAASNIPLFDASAAMLPGGALRLVHQSRPELLRPPTPGTLAETADVLRGMARRADAVLLTCSTVGEAVELLRDEPCPILRADAALAEAAARGGGDLQVLYAAPTTRGPTERLFKAAATPRGANVTFHLVEGAWALFLAGELEAYHALIAASARGLAGRVVLAQASMAGAAALIEGPPALTLPAVAVMSAARAAMSARKSG